MVRNLTGGPRPFFAEGYRKAYAANFGLITGDPGRTMPLTRAATTDGIVFRADPGLSRDAGGSGLGLAIVRSIARVHQGSIAVRSGDGHTRFVLQLPMTPDRGQRGTT